MAFLLDMPGNDLKEILLKHLKNLCTFNHVIKFCELLISGQKLVEQSKNIVLEDSDLMSNLLQKSDAIFEQIKGVIAKISVEVLIQKLSEALWEKKIKDEKKLQIFLLETDNCNSLEYLERIIIYIEQMIKLYWNIELFYVCFDDFADPVQDITELDRFVRCTAFPSAAIALGAILQLTLDNVESTVEEKIEWGRLFLETADVIKQSVKKDVKCPFLRLEYVSQMRSCIQCVLDLFLERPPKDASSLCKWNKINDCKDIYDLLIERKSKLPLRYDSDDLYDWDCENTCDGDDSDVYDLISKMPSSHTWWKKFKEGDEHFQT